MSDLETRNLLEAGDVEGLRAVWARFPGMPQPENREQAEITMHYARTAADSIAMRTRAYSHAWLCERGMPSGLPEALKASAERMYPVTVLGVGISVNTKNPLLAPAMGEIRESMEHAVLDAQADGRLADAPFVKARMNEARERSMRALFGR